MIIVPIVVGLFMLFIIMILLSMTLAPILMADYAPIEIYTFLVRLSILWAGLIWITAAIYVSIVTHDNQYGWEVWLSFSIGALMIYSGLGGTFVTSGYWLGIRTIFYLLLSLAAVIYMEHIRSLTNSENPSDHIISYMVDSTLLRRYRDDSRARRR